jgi:hypothetical protein
LAGVNAALSAIDLDAAGPEAGRAVVVDDGSTIHWRCTERRMRSPPFTWSR